MLGGGGGVERAGGGLGAEVGGGGGAAGGVEALGGGGLGAEDGGGGGAAGGEGALGGGRGAEAGGGGGAGGGDGAADLRGREMTVEGFREVGGGGGFAAVGSGGGARGGRSEFDRKEASEFGLDAGLGGGLRRLATNGYDAEYGCGGDNSVVCGVGLKSFSLGAVGGLGAEEVGGFGTDFRDVSGSEIYDGSLSAPVSIPPPVFRSFGMPTPANIPPN